MLWVTGFCALGERGLSDPSRKCLFIGLGSGALPAFFHHHFSKLLCEVVEIDPAVVCATTAFLGFPTKVVDVSDACAEDKEGLQLALNAASMRDTEAPVPVTLSDAAAFVQSKVSADAGTSS